MAKSETVGAQNSARDVPSLTLRASVKAGSVDLKKRTAEVVFTTGARVMRGGFWEEPFLEELSMDPKHVRMERLNNGAPLLNNHDGWRGLEAVIGVVDSAELDGKQGVATVRFSSRADVEPIFRDVGDGIIQNVSVGYRVHKFEKVEGGEGKIPVMRATDWEPFEISAVPMGADDGAGFRSADPSKSTNRCEFVVATREEDPMTMKTVAAVAAALATTPEVPVVPTADARRAEETARDAAVAAEMTRAQQIRTAVRAAKLDEGVADKLIADKATVDAARAHVLDQLATRSEQTTTTQHNRMEVGEEASDKFARGATAALLFRAGVSEFIKRTDPKLETDPGEFRSLSLLGIARECLERSGINTRRMSNRALIEAAMLQRSGYASTSDFPVLFESVLHKMLLGNYKTTPDTWSKICKETSTPDFKVSNRYRNGSFGTLDALNEHGEFKNKSIPDGAKTTIQIGTIGNIIGVTRQMLINDDMGAFADLATRFGRAAALSIEVEFYRQLALNAGLGPDQADGQPFFHANRANVNATGSAISVGGIDADRVKMRAQKDQSSNEYLDIAPAILLVHPGLLAAAKVINNSAFDHTTTNNQKPNAVQGLFSEIVDSPRLSASVTRRYLFAPKEFGTVEAAFLEGQGNNPVLETEDGWRIDGVEWKLRLDFAIKFMDGKGAVTNAGV